MKLGAALLCALVFALPVWSAQEQSPEAKFKALREVFTTEKAKIDADLEAFAQGGLASYREMLEAAEAAAKKAGDIKAVLALQGETKRFDTEQTVPGKVPDKAPDGICKAVLGHASAQARGQKLRDEKVYRLLGLYVPRLEALKAEALQADEMAVAQEVDKELKKTNFLVADIAARWKTETRESSAPSSSDESADTMGGGAPSGESAQMWVFANKRNWQNSGLLLKPGTKLTVQADGLWSVNGGRWVTADDPGNKLMAKVGDQEFEAGAQWKGVISGEGFLQFRSKDWAWCGDNDGCLKVAISCDPPAEATDKCLSECVVREIDYQFFTERIQQKVECEVSAKEGWQSAGCEVKAGTRLQLSARGQWGNRPADTTSTPDSPQMLLMCKISQEPQSPEISVFPVGRGASIKTPISGKLYFRCRDAGLHDNHGSVKVAIRGNLYAE